MIRTGVEVAIALLLSVARAVISKVPPEPCVNITFQPSVWSVSVANNFPLARKSTFTTQPLISVVCAETGISIGDML